MQAEPATPSQADQTEALGWLRVLKRAIEEVNQRSEEGAKGPLLVAGFAQLLSPLLDVKSYANALKPEPSTSAEWQEVFQVQKTKSLFFMRGITSMPVSAN